MVSSTGSAGGDWPEWLMPPVMIGRHVLGPVILARSESAVAVLRQALAFPSGLALYVEAHARTPRRAAPQDVVIPRAGGDLTFRVRFADGRAAILGDDAGLRNGNGPMLTTVESQSSSGGPQGMADTHLTLWLWPLPPPGDVELSCSWRQHGLADSALVLDGAAAAAAGAQAEPLWPAR